MRRVRAVGVAVVTMLTAVLLSATLTGPVQAQPTDSPATTRTAAELHPIVDLSAQRVLVGDLVAASKWGTGGPIEDPDREQVVLDSVAELAREHGTDPDRVVAIFRDQIEANKIVQRGLHRHWENHPDQAPTEPPDLDEVRQEINRLNVGIVASIAATETERDSLLCGVGLLLAKLRVVHDHDLDALHARALNRSVDSVCG